MTTHNHTAIAIGAAANASTFNTPLGAMDAAIGDLTTLTTLAKTSAVAAINEVSMEVQAARGIDTSLEDRFDRIDTRIDNIIYGGVDLDDPLIFESGLTINDFLYLDVSRQLNNEDAGPINLPVWIKGDYTTPGDGYSVRHIYGNAKSSGIHDILTLATIYTQTVYDNTAGNLTHGWGGVFRFYKTGDGGDILLCAGVYADVNVSGSGTIQQISGYYQNPSIISDGTIVAHVGIDLNEPNVTDSGVVQHNTMLRVGSATVGEIDNYGIYVEPCATAGIYNDSDFVNTGTATIGDDTTIDGDLDVLDGDFSLIGSSTLGSNLVANGDFSADTTGWTAVSATISSVAGGQSGNGLLVANAGGTGHALQALTTEVNAWYKLEFYYKSGTALSAAYYIGTSSGGAEIGGESLATAADWTKYVARFQAVGTTTYVRFGPSGSIGTETSLFDTITVKRMLGGNLGVNGKITAYGGTYGIKIEPDGQMTSDKKANFLAGISSFAVTLADDTVVDLRALYSDLPQAGMILLSSGQLYDLMAIINYRCSSSPHATIIQSGSRLVSGTTELTDGSSDGTDAKYNVAAVSNGKLQLKNRLGTSYTVTITVLC